jgi:hypothetical protein
MPTIADAILMIIADLEHSPQPETAKAAFKQLLLQKLDGLQTEGEQRVHFARRLLDQGMPRSMIRDRLQVRFKVKRTQAYRDIEQALQLSLPIGTAEGSTDVFQ